MSEAGSQRDASETSSVRNDNAELKKRNRIRNGAGEDGADLLEQKKSLQEGIHAAMYMLASSKSIDNWKMALIKVLLEGLIPLLVVFNPTNDWGIRTSNPVWQVVRWALPRSPVARIWGYDTYIRVFYAMVGFVYVAVGAIAVLTLAMRRQEHSKALKRFARFLSLLTDVTFSLLYVAILDFMTFLFNCNFTGKHGHEHNYFTEVQCFEMPHIIHLAVAGVTSIIFFASTALMLVAASALNPVATGIMASPAASSRLRVLAVKAAFVVIVNTLGFTGKVQAVLIVLSALLITWWNLVRLPFLRLNINTVWVANWAAVSYTCGIFCMFKFNKNWKDPNVQQDVVELVLYGIFPVYLASCFFTWLYIKYRMRSVAKFEGVDPAMKLKKVHEFGSPDDVEVLSRTMREFDSDGAVLEDAALRGEMVIKCGMAVFPAHVDLLILFSNFLMDVKRDGPAARTQLQLALKGGPSMVQRYQIFSTVENSKRLKDGQEGQLDLQSYVEFKRNYRAVIRVHKAALTAQRDFWQLMQKSSVRVSAVEGTLRGMDEAADTAHQVYKRVLERYPSNGKLLKCYGKFLEDVRNDVIAASRAYTEAARNGGGDGLLSLDLQVHGADKPEFLTSMDLHEDACIVINAEGLILMVNACVSTLLGYAKTELEGANVNMIMPQPFSGRHASYLTRYAQGGEPHILDTVRDVVALHKDRFVFPLQLCVTKLSGIGTDAIFLGVLRPAPLDARNVRAWVAPNGVILCTDPQFASLTGLLNEQMVGQNFQSLVTDMAGLDSLLELCKEAPYEELLAGTIVRQFSLVHRHLAPVPVEIKVTPGGTDTQRIFVLNAHRTDGNTDGLIVVDGKGSFTFATWDVAAMLGFPLKKFLKMKLDQLMPSPFATMHLKHLRDHSAIVPPTSCRAGRLVSMTNSNGVQVPVRLVVATQDDALTGHTKHVVSVRKVDGSNPAELHADRRLVLLCAMDGKILHVDQPDSALFGFTSSAVTGTNLADCIDVFAEWRDKAGAHQMELLLLSLLDKEGEMPGTSWRVKIHGPETEDTLPNIDPRAPKRASQGRSACLQTEIVENGAALLQSMDDDLASSLAGLSGLTGAVGGGDATSSLARIILWRRDLLTGVIELDDKLVVRKADTNTGLIVGVPAGALARMPLHKLLDVPRGVPWDDLMQKDKKKKSALKGSTGLVVSPLQAFEGPHPDGGTMRIFVQGVSGGSGNRIYATMHPDTTFTGARADLHRALGLEALINGTSGAAAHPAHAGAAAHPEPAHEPKLKGKLVQSNMPDKLGAVEEVPDVPRPPAEVEVDELPPRDDASMKESSSSSSEDDDGSGSGGGEGDKEEEGGPGSDVLPDGSVKDAAEAAKMHMAAHNQSEFVAQWVRTLTRQTVSLNHDPAGDLDDLPASRAGTKQHSGDLEVGKPSKQMSRHMSGTVAFPSKNGSRKKLELAPVDEDQVAEGDREEEEEDDGNGDDGQLSRRDKSGLSGAGGKPPSIGDDGASSQGDDDDATSQGLGQAFSDVTSQVDVDLATDARRGRLLKRLLKLLAGPRLAGPLTRMRHHTLALLGVMLLAHVVVYIVFTSIVSSQFSNVREVHRLALAADRCQVVTVKAAIAEFCSRPGVAAESVCEITLNQTVTDMRAALDDLETYHQSIYLGNSLPRKITEPEAYRLWTDRTNIFQVYLDVTPPRWVNETLGAWQLGNRFLATGRELLYWAHELQGRIMPLRQFQFVLATGPRSLFAGYTDSLNYLVNHAWQEVAKVQTSLLVMLVVEAGIIQLACIVYQFFLVRAVEAARYGAMLAGLGLPGPMLRVLASRPVVVYEDSDDEDGDDEEGGDGGGHADGDHADHAAGAGGGQGRNRRASVDSAVGGPPELRGGQSGDSDQDLSGGGVGGHPGWAAGAGEQSERAAPVGGVVIGSKKGTAAGLHRGRGGHVCVNGKELVHSAAATAKFMTPFVLWEITLIVIGVVSYLRLQGMQGPLASLNMASHVIYRYTRVRVSAFLLVSGTSVEERAGYRQDLVAELAYLQDEYTTLMYGGTSITQLGSVFSHPVPASTFQSTSFSSNFFKAERCFRWDQSNCYQVGSPYYEVTHHGLDVMMRRVISEMTLLAADEDAEAAYNGTRYTTMYRVGVKDLYEGLQSSAELYVDFSIQRYNSIKLLHTLMLIATVFVFLAYASFLLRPYAAATEKEAARLAGLLSHVPAEMDVTAHCRQVLRNFERLSRPTKGHRLSVEGGAEIDKTVALLDNVPVIGRV